MTKIDAPRLSILASGLVWLYGSQIGVTVLQFAYAAASSRVVTPSEFGAYAVALAISALATLLSSAGLGQTIARIDEVSAARIRALILYAAVVGASGAAILLLTINLWAWVWSNDAAKAPLYWLAILCVVSPLTGLFSGLLRRRSQFRRLAILMCVSSLGGMIGGLGLVIHFRDASALVGFPIIAQLMLLATAAYSGRDVIFCRTQRARRTGDLSFSSSIVSLSVLTYVTTNMVRLVVSRVFGSAVLGSWNRAETITSVPLFQLQNAIVQVVYPEFRQDISSSKRAFVVWSDLLVMIQGLTFAFMGLYVLLAPNIIPLLFGPGWDEAASLVVGLTVAGCLQLISIVLASALEATAHFRTIWVSEAAVALTQSGLLWCAIVHDAPLELYPLILAASWTMRHFIQLWFTGRAGYVDVPRVCASYGWCLLWCLSIYPFVYWAFTAHDLWTSVIACLELGTISAGVFAFRNKFDLVITCRRYLAAFKGRSARR